MVVLGNLSISLLFGMPSDSDSGSWRATETTDGDRDNTISSSLAPEERFESLIGCERSSVLLLFLSRKFVSKIHTNIWPIQ